MVHETSCHAVAFHVTQLLNEHLFGHGRDRTAQLRKAAHVPTEEMEEDHELPSTLENPQDFFDTFRGGSLGMLELTFG
jgi:hypothetical protein